MNTYLNGEARWRLTIWRTQTGAGHNPRAGGVEWHQCSHWSNIQVRHRYVIAALALRTDLTYDDEDDPKFVPGLISAVGKAADSCRPQNYRGN
ncbi:hypothetical protein [Streptomyces sp. KR55]|uniref:hypothetical protein n=1 Tax=Streptomyces sp. KR55 TaxID=3457425 RepID=UPI003FD1C0CB